ncbi:hypothetical protein Tco_1464853 [Tanacetum coccineum]
MSFLSTGITSYGYGLKIVSSGWSFGASFTQRKISSISTVSISLEDFMPSILLLMVIIVAVVIVMVIWAVVVVVGGVSFIIKLSFMSWDNTLYKESFHSRLDVFLGSELGLLSLAIDAACVFRAEEMPSLISCWMAAKVVPRMPKQQFIINLKKLNMDYQNGLNRLQEMMNLINSNQDPPVNLYHLEGSNKGDKTIDSLTKEPLDTLLMGDEAISTTPERENDEFIKSSVDDLVSIPRESEVTSVCDNFECDMPVNTPSPTTDVREENLDINLLLGEHLDTLSTGDREVDFNPSRDIKELERLLADDLVPVPRVFDEPLGHSDSISRSYDVTFSNPLFDFNGEFTLCNDNPLFDEEFEDISSLDPPESTLVIDESFILSSFYNMRVPKI